MSAAPEADLDPVIRIRGLRTQFGANVIHDGLGLDVARGEVMGIVGGSGTGKSVLLRTIIGLNAPAAGQIEIFNQEVTNAADEERLTVQRRIGVLFQDGALFSSLTVAQNIAIPLAEHTSLSPQLRSEIADVKINLVGLPLDAANKSLGTFGRHAQARRPRTRIGA